MLRVEQLIALGVNEETAHMWTPNFAEVCNNYEINTPLRMSHFFAQIMVESAKLAVLEEDLDYSADGLANTWPTRYAERSFGQYVKLNRRFKPNGVARKLHRKPEAIANHCYAGRMGNGPEESGDGWRYRGFGPKQVTGKNNHMAFAEFIGVRFEDYNPSDLTQPLLGAESAAWFWVTNNLNRLADADDPIGVSRVVNGGDNGLQQRIAATELGIEQVFA